MRVNINTSSITSALIVMAVVSLLVMISLTQIDHLVHGDLYNFGLRFSYRWAMPYWIYSGIIIISSLFNIVASIALTYLILKRKTGLKLKGEEAEKVEEEDRQQQKLGEYVKPPEEPIPPVERPTRLPGEAPSEGLIEIQVKEQLEVPTSPIKKYDVRRPKDVVDSQC